MVKKWISYDRFKKCKTKLNGRPEINGQQENYGKPANSVTPQFQGSGGEDQRVGNWRFRSRQMTITIR